MAALPTCRVKRLAIGDVVTINDEDFDPSQHERVNEPAPTSMPPAAESSAPSTDGDASVQAEADEPPVTLRDDGPTIEEFVAAGYPEQQYPPTGYTEKDSLGLDEFKAKLIAMIEGNAQAAVAAIESITGPKALDRLERLESAGKKRVSVLRAIAERRDGLQATE